jgi:phage FluMu protein Com
MASPTSTTRSALVRWQGWLLVFSPARRASQVTVECCPAKRQNVFDRRFSSRTVDCCTASGRVSVAMPIRFRCAYCNQLLGIARRKAGTVVRCPNCSGQVVVPTLEEAGLSDGPQATAGQQLFEGNEIDRLLEGAAGDQPSAIAPPPRSTSAAAPVGPSAPAAVAPPPAPAKSPEAPPQPLVSPAGFPGPATPPNGIWLSPAKATMLSVIAVVALAVAFGVGLLVGLFLQSTR